MQDANGMQAIFVLNMTQLQAIPNKKDVPWEEEGSEIPAPHVSAGAAATRHAPL